MDRVAGRPGGRQRIDGDLSGRRGGGERAGEHGLRVVGGHVGRAVRQRMDKGW